MSSVACLREVRAKKEGVPQQCDNTVKESKIIPRRTFVCLSKTVKHLSANAIVVTQDTRHYITRTGELRVRPEKNLISKDIVLNAE